MATAASSLPLLEANRNRNGKHHTKHARNKNSRCICERRAERAGDARLLHADGLRRGRGPRRRRHVAFALSAVASGASVVMLAVGFIQHYRAPQCDRNRARWSSAILWAAAAIVLTNLIFPQWIAGLMAGPAR